MKRGQASMEFLMTYGWILLVGLLAISALAYFGVLNPDRFGPRSCVLEPGISCSDMKVNEDSVSLVLQNGRGAPMIISSLSVEGCIGSVSGTLADGQEQLYTITGCSNTVHGKFKGDIAMTYTSDTGVSHDIVGTIVDNVETGTAIPENWFDSTWKFRKKITLSGAQVSGAHTGFPVLISITDMDLSANAQVNGDDILFTDSTGTIKISHDIESYASGTFVAWVTVPTLSAGSDTVIYIYYGNPTAPNQQNVADTWSNGYEAVYHIHDDFDDSTSTHDATNAGSLDVTGIIARGQDFVPESHIDLGAWSVEGSQLTVQAWANFDNLLQDDPRILSKAVNGGSQDHVFMLSLSGSGEQYLRSRIKTGSVDTAGTQTLLSSQSPIAPGQWYHLAATYDGQFMHLFRNGVNVVNTSHAGLLRENNWKIWAGHNPDSGSLAQYSLDGKLDEIRISSIARSTDWLRTEYNNQVNPSAFYTIDSEENVP